MKCFDHEFFPIKMAAWHCHNEVAVNVCCCVFRHSKTMEEVLLSFEYIFTEMYVYNILI